MKVGVVSLGCVKNRVDTEQMLDRMLGAGYELTMDPAEAEIILVNTCGFIESAKEESIDTIFEMAQYKEKGCCRVLCVTGCLAQRYADDLLRDIPEIDCLLGVNQYGRIAELIGEALGGDRPRATERNEGFLECGRVLTTPPYSAYVKIGDGCDNRCTYCAIPLIRGRHRSRPMDDILREMQALADGGAREQILIAQDTTRYGKDIGLSLSELLRQGARTEGLEWLRVLYMYPDETDDALLQLMAETDRVVKYLDLPLQHASAPLLKRMNRRGDPEASRRLLKKARQMGFCLRTTFIVGFPGETEEDFARLMDFTEEICFDRMGAFAYSPEEDTPAAGMPDQVPDEIKQERLDRLMTLQVRISLARNQARIGSSERVLICGRQGEHYLARSAFEAPDADGVIRLSSAGPLAEGAFYQAKITGADTYDLFGEVM
ncbi:MAG: 30S ribosomal protein S12 methylthiotransferase RimO [Clostridia bacterium]|nr:30S ribosomal protein S12 methylthiotransferase RimO [Clostridia bacterium]